MRREAEEAQDVLLPELVREVIENGTQLVQEDPIPVSPGRPSRSGPLRLWLPLLLPAPLELRHLRAMACLQDFKSNPMPRFQILAPAFEFVLRHGDEDCNTK